MRDELEADRREIASLKEQLDCLVRDHKNLLGILDRAGCLRYCKRPCTDSTGGDDQHRRRMRAHPARQLNRVCITLAVQYTKWDNVFRSSLLLPTLVTACLGRFTVDSNTRSLTYNEEHLLFHSCPHSVFVGPPHSRWSPGQNGLPLL